MTQVFEGKRQIKLLQLAIDKLKDKD